MTRTRNILLHLFAHASGVRCICFPQELKKNKIILFFPVFLFALNIAFSQKPGDNLFGSPLVHYVNISFPDPDFYSHLTGNYESTRDKDTNIFIMAKIFIDSLFLDSVGIRLKGNSSYDHPGLKKPVKISFSEYLPDQTFDNLKQLNLNNGYMDPTMMREKLMLDLLNKKGWPAPRCTYAEVYFNGIYAGLFKMVEEVDKKFLKTHFGNNDGNLYKGDPAGTLQWEGNAQWDYYDSYDLKTNEKENNWDDLVRFIGVLNHSPMAGFKLRTDALFNATPFIGAWAANNLFVNLDSYFFLPHNYYLYHNENTGKFEWITWDVSLAFGVFPGGIKKMTEKTDLLYLPVQRQKHPLTYKMLETDDYRKEYLNALCDLLYNDFTEAGLFPKIDSIASVIRPYIEKEYPHNQMYSTGEFERNLSNGSVKKWYYEIPGLKSFISSRRSYAIEQMCEIKWSCSAGTSTEDSASSIMNVFPNPAAGEFSVDLKILEPESRKIEYKVVNLLGETVFSETATSPSNQYLHSFSTEKLISGIYIISSNTGCARYNKKLVVIK